MKADFTPAEIDARRSDIVAKASGQRVKTFVCDAWTFEYSLAVEMESRGLPDDEFSVHVYAHFVTGTKASKAIAAQYLAQILEWELKRGKLTPAELRDRLPAYLVEAIEYVCPVPVASATQPAAAVP